MISLLSSTLDARCVRSQSVSIWAQGAVWKVDLARSRLPSRLDGLPARVRSGFGRRNIPIPYICHPSAPALETGLPMLRREGQKC